MLVFLPLYERYLSTHGTHDNLLFVKRRSVLPRSPMLGSWFVNFVCFGPGIVLHSVTVNLKRDMCSNVSTIRHRSLLDMIFKPCERVRQICKILS
jgi:hypothetical protein